MFIRTCFKYVDHEFNNRPCATMSKYVHEYVYTSVEIELQPDHCGNGNKIIPGQLCYNNKQTIRRFSFEHTSRYCKVI